MFNLELADEIVEELSDERYLGLIHGMHGAYDKGCRGVLCRKYNRDKSRETYAKRHPQVRRARSPRDPELDDLLTRVIAEHAQQVLAARASKVSKDILAAS